MANSSNAIRFFVALAAIASLLPLPAAAAPAAKGSGASLCVLTQADFRTFGTIVYSKPTAHVEEGGSSAYCLYRGKSGATGGVELDVFYPAGDAPADIEETFKTVLGSDPGAKYLPEAVPGADASVYSLSVPQPGYFPFAANAVRRGSLVFSISLPSSPLAKAELLRLSQIVLSRISK
jgi:hypothetical protein